MVDDPIEEARQRWLEQGWVDAAPGLAFAAALARTQQIFVSKLELELRPLGLSLARFEVLMQLTFTREGAMALSRLRDRLQVAPGAVTNVIDRLESDGYVTRDTSPSDGRVTIATVTKSGRRLGMKAARLLNKRVYEALEIPAEQIEEAFEQLQAIRRSLGDIPAGNERASLGLRQPDS